MASRFWVGGTGTWDNSSTTHWSATTGGSSGASVPGSADTVTFDGSSGGGTVTVNTTVTVTSITADAFTGTLDFSANNNNVTLSGTSNALSCSGSATKTLNMGTGTWTFTGASGTLINMQTTANLTLSASSCNIAVTSTSSGTKTLTLNTGKQLGNVTISANSNSGAVDFNGGNGTYTSITVTGPNRIMVASANTITVSGTLSLNGSAGSPIFLTQDGNNISGGNGGFSKSSGSPTVAWTAIAGMTFSGGATWAATNSFDCGKNSGITINSPSGGAIQYTNSMRGNLG